MDNGIFQCIMVHSQCTMVHCECTMVQLNQLWNSNISICKGTTVIVNQYPHLEIMPLKYLLLFCLKTFILDSIRERSIRIAS